MLDGDKSANRKNGTVNGFEEWQVKIEWSK